MNNKMFRKITLSLLLVALVMVAGIILTNAGGRAQGKDAQPVSRLATLGDNVLAALSVPAAESATFSVDLCASNGTITLPDGATVPVWGFVETTNCLDNLIDDNNFPGPTILAMAGDSITINLTNQLDEATSVMIPGQNVAATGDAGIFTAEAAPNGGTATYEFTARAGTHLYESGTNASIQIPMGLYGPLIVDYAPGQAYLEAESAYDVEATLLLSEIDPNLNGNPAGFDLLDYHPTYWLINGVAYPDTDNIMADPGQQVLLRYLNAGFDYPSMALLGAYQEVIAKDAYALTNTFDVVAETIPAGTTADMIVDTTGLDGPLPLYNRNAHVTNGDAFPGGMLTFIQVGAPVGDPPAINIDSPAQGSTVFGDTVAVQISASDTEDADGSLTVEWRIDGGAWQMATNSPVGSTTYVATWDTTVFSDGSTTIQARAIDSDNRTATDSNSVNVSNQPSISIVAPAEGATVFGDAVAIQIDASDAEDAPGTLTVEWSDDGGATWQTASWVSPYYEATLDTTSLADGALTIDAQATDSRANTASDSNNVTVSNEPAVTIIAPAEGATVFGDAVAIQIDASDAEDAPGTLTVEWSDDGGATWHSTDYVGGFYVNQALDSWDTTGLPDGSATIQAQATDSRSNMAGDSNSVTVSNNPAVTIVTPAEGATVTSLVTVQIDGSDAEDDAGGAGGLTVTWDVDSGAAQPATWNGTSGFYEATWDTATAGSGPHTINASAEDSRGNIATDSNNVTVGANSIHIGDLDGSSAPGGGPNWTASVMATVHYTGEIPVEGATVTMQATRTRKSNGNGVLSTLTCVTDVAGQCMVSQSVNSNQFENNVSFTVTNVTNAAPYVSADNHDPDGDSDGTTIIVQR